MSWKNNKRLLSQPIRLFWNGWESDTYKLQQNGWELSVQQDLQYMRMAIAIKHKKLGMRGLSDSMGWNYLEQRETFQDPRSTPGFGCQIASNIDINYTGSMSNVEFNPIDATPMWQTIERKSLDDIAHFRKIEKPNNEIFLKEASLKEIMAMALSRQEPPQEQIRKLMIQQDEIEVMRNSQLRANLRLVT